MSDGRPRALTPQIEHAICDLVREGVPLIDAAHPLERGERTVYRWVRLAKVAGNARSYERLVDGLAAAQAEREHHVRQVVARVRPVGRFGAGLVTRGDGLGDRL